MNPLTIRHEQPMFLVPSAFPLFSFFFLLVRGSLVSYLDEVERYLDGEREGESLINGAERVLKGVWGGFVGKGI